MDVYGALDITFSLRSAQNWYPPTTGTNSNWTTVQQDEDRLLRWQRQSHKGEKMALNIWIVPGLSGFEVNGVRMGLLGVCDSRTSLRCNFGNTLADHDVCAALVCDFPQGYRGEWEGRWYCHAGRHDG